MNKPLTLIATALALLVAVGAHATTIRYTAALDGPSEFPPNASPGTGWAKLVYDDVAHTFQVKASFADLIGFTTVAHIHCCTAVPLTGNAGVATQVPTFPGFPGGVQSGVYNSALFDLTLAGSWNPAFVTSSGGVPQAEARLAAGLASGSAYFNVHSTQFPGGEIRGFLIRKVPEPSSLALLALGLAGLGLARRRKA